jgi:DNA-binding FrmR family transcriptional regulator
MLVVGTHFAMDGKIVDGRIELRRSGEEKKPLLNRLSRIEGQVRGLRTMIEEDRYCLDEMQQINAIAAALREVSLAIIAQHVRQGIQVAVQEQDGSVAIDDVMKVLRSAMRNQV